MTTVEQSLHRFYLPSIFISVLIIGLFGCAHKPCAIYSKQKKPLTIIEKREKTACLLNSTGVDVLPVGEMVKMIVPSDRLFINDTPEFTENYKHVLATAADFIRSFSVIIVEVAGYNDTVDLPIKSKEGSFSEELTRLQADAVANYLWRHHVNARLLVAIGKDGKHMIAWNGSRIGRHLNRRIEITFRYYRNNKAWY